MTALIELTELEREALEDMTIQALEEDGMETREYNQSEFWGQPVVEVVMADWVNDILDSVDEMLSVCGYDSIEEFRREYVS